MKKVLLLGFGSVSHMPYMNLYIDTFKNSEIDLVCWEREGHSDIEVPTGINQLFIHTDVVENSIPLRYKLLHFFGYRRFVCKILRDKKYDLVVSMQAAPGLVLLDKLLLAYRRRYILDFRDLSYEHILLYRFLTDILAKNAMSVFVSSDAFREYLPSNIEIYSVHNYLEESLSYQRATIDKSKQPLRICFWGLLRGYETNCRLMEALGNDDRFELHYYGHSGICGNMMKQFADKHSLSNVFFHGSYMPMERYDFIVRTDLIHNAFDLDRTMKNAVSNKYYDGLIFGIPQLCTKGSYMGTLVTNNGVGMEIDPLSAGLAEQIYSYYRELNVEQFTTNCNRTMKTVFEDQAKVKQVLNQFEQ